MRTLLGWAVVAIVTVAAGCSTDGGDQDGRGIDAGAETDAGGTGYPNDRCGSDVQCKGDRICVDGECVYPPDMDASQTEAGTGGGGTGGSGGTGGDSGGSGYRDGSVGDVGVDGAIEAGIDGTVDAGETFEVGGAVDGLASGNSVVLRVNDTEDVTVDANGSYALPTALADGSAYDVAVKTQPTTPNQTCVVANHEGIIDGGDVTDIDVTCTTNTYTVGGTVNGLAGTGLVLRNNDGDNKTIVGNGSFTFFAPLADDSAYSVTVYQHPSSPSQTCTVNNSSGIISGGNVTDVFVACWPGLSCTGMGNVCNDDGTAVSCCGAKLVQGGTFPMGRCGDGGDGCDDEYDGGTDEIPEHNATVTDFYLDTFEVTVGRFRTFVGQYDGTPPIEGAGAHPLMADSGWQAAWDSFLPSTQEQLKSTLRCNTTNETWTESAADNEQYPANCVNWYTAFAFCIWDGGRLPTEAEWEYASAGGDANRLYPWGSEAPNEVPLRANYYDTAFSSFVDVGSYPAGAGRWGQHDLAGSMWEWTLDTFDAAWYLPGAGNPCTNCANLASSPYRVGKGGVWDNYAQYLRAAYRSGNGADNRYFYFGFRCARDVP